MSTAYTQNRRSDSLNIFWNKLESTTSYYFYMHFSELEKLQTNQSRGFTIYINGNLFYRPVVPQYLQEYTVYSKRGSKPNLVDTTIDIWLNNTENSTLPPIINALEMYKLRELSGQETNQNDVEAMSKLKSVYGLKKIKWQGDPCAPEIVMWDGLNCSYDSNNPSRIVSLDLSSSGLKGEIDLSFANLTMLKYLDLSNNNLSGTVPAILAQLSFLEILNLRGNNLTGPIPEALSEREKKGLILSLDKDPSIAPCSSESCRRKKKNFFIPLVASLGGIIFIGLATLVAIWSYKRRRQQNEKNIDDYTIDGKSTDDDGEFVSKKQRYTFSDIQRITNKFERVLGEGGFGKVYHGYLNGIQVAVKMLSPSSVQGQRQFHTELKLLLRVHHKKLTSLVGYCNEGSNIGLIYEYMAMGDLQSHLSGSNRNILTWEDRLRIAIDTAQGLEYLHNGCKPPIVHRDVKSTNILLNERLLAKLGDFGLSKIFPFEGGNHVSTYGSNTPGVSASIVGTPGYLDPEYFATNWLNEKSDVYSFGVVLLEIVTARPVLTKTRENNHIIKWVSSMLAKGDIKSIIDPHLKEGTFDINTVWKVIEISMACVSKSSTNRPTMSRVATELKECLTTKITRKDRHDEDEYSKDSAEMISRNMISEFSPLAR